MLDNVHPNCRAIMIPADQLKIDAEIAACEVHGKVDFETELYLAFD